MNANTGNNRRPPNGPDKKNRPPANHKSRNPRDKKPYTPRNVRGSDITLHQHTLKDAPKRQSHHSGNNRGKYNKGSNRPSSMTISKIFRRYDYLTELHIIARRKFFKNHYHMDQRLVNKLERNFHETLRQLWDFKNSLNRHQFERLNEKYNGLPTDTTYSENHGIDQKGEITPEDYQIMDPHITNFQKESSFTNDTEESKGTSEDYKAFKNI